MSSGLLLSRYTMISSILNIFSSIFWSFSWFFKFSWYRTYYFCRLANLQACRPADRQTCRPADLQTYRLANLQACRPADLQTYRSAGLQVCRSASLKVSNIDLRSTNSPPYLGKNGHHVIYHWHPQVILLKKFVSLQNTFRALKWLISRIGRLFSWALARSRVGGRIFGEQVIHTDLQS